MNAGGRPNVVLVVADDLGWGDLGCYGAERIPTPNIDALAVRGTRYTDCHASSAVCTPSRYSLLTGRYAWRGPLRRSVLGGFDPAIIEPDRPTIASMLGDAGYATGAFGKWHLGLGWRHRDGSVRDAFAEAATAGTDERGGAVGVVGDLEDPGFDVDYRAPFTGGPVELGFDRFFGISGSLDMAPYCFLEDDRVVGIPDREKEIYHPNQRRGLQVPGWADDQVDVRVCTEACDWIRDASAGEEPFFAYVAAAAPHRPCVPPEFVRGASSAGVRGDAVCLVDWMVGELVETLERAGVLDNTIVIFTSDNGAPLIYPEDGDIVEHRPNGPWRGQKADIWEAGHRVPLIVAGPEGLLGPAGPQVVGATVCLTDLLPTMAAWAETVTPEDAELDGLPLRWDDATDTADAPDAVGTGRALIHHSLDGWFAVREGDWKCVLGSGSGGFSEPHGSPDAPGQLFDLWLDPGEERNAWADFPAVVADLQALGGSISRDRATGYPFARPSEEGRTGC